MLSLFYETLSGFVAISIKGTLASLNSEEQRNDFERFRVDRGTRKAPLAWCFAREINVAKDTASSLFHESGI